MKDQFWFWYADKDGKWLLENVNEPYHLEPAHSKGDLIGRMSTYAVCTGDPAVIKACIKLVNERMRWPESLICETDSKNRLQYWFSRMKYFHFGAIQHRYGPRKNISRDCCIGIIIATYLHQYEMIRDIKIPLKINRLWLHYWFKYLKTHDAKYKAKFERWKMFSINISIAFKFPAFVKSLTSWMIWLVRSDRLKQKMLPLIPEWNILNRMLCGDEITNSAQIDSYQSREGWYWNEENNDNNRFLGQNEPFYLDKEILEFVFENQDWK